MGIIMTSAPHTTTPMPTPRYITSVGCSLISSSVGNHKDLELTQIEQSAVCSTLARHPYFAATPTTIVSLIGTVSASAISPLVLPDGIGASGFFDPNPFPGYIIQILGSDLERVVGNTFQLTWTFSSLRYGADGPIQHQAVMQLDKPGARGTFVGIIPAHVVSGKSRLATPHLWRPGSAGAPADTISVTALATGMTAQVRLLTHHDGAFAELWPALHVRLSEKG